MDITQAAISKAICVKLWSFTNISRPNTPNGSPSTRGIYVEKTTSQLIGIVEKGARASCAKRRGQRGEASRSCAGNPRSEASIAAKIRFLNGAAEELLPQPDFKMTRNSWRFSLPAWRVLYR